MRRTVERTQIDPADAPNHMYPHRRDYESYRRQQEGRPQPPFIEKSTNWSYEHPLVDPQLRHL